MHQFTGVLWMSANGRNFNRGRQKAPFLYLPMMLSQKQTFTVPLLYTNCCQAMREPPDFMELPSRQRDMAGIRWPLPEDTEQSRDLNHICHWASCGKLMG